MVYSGIGAGRYTTGTTGTGTGISMCAVAVFRENTWELPIELPGLRCRPNLFCVNAIALALVKEMETGGGWWIDITAMTINW